MSPAAPVAAAPFRAHVRHVCSACAVSHPVLAVEAGLPVSLIRNLIDDRDGRRVHRIAAELAERLLALDAAELDRRLRSQVSARQARIALLRSLDAGLAPASIADRLHLSVGEIQALALGRTLRVSRRVEIELQLMAAAVARGAVVPARRTGSPRPHAA